MENREIGGDSMRSRPSGTSRFWTKFEMSVKIAESMNQEEMRKLKYLDAKKKRKIAETSSQTMSRL